MCANYTGDHAEIPFVSRTELEGALGFDRLSVVILD